jgi:hypothetical protein
MSPLAPKPWATLPPELADVLRPELPLLADEIIAAIGRDVPDYARPLEGPFGTAVRSGVQIALGRFLDEVGRSGDPEGRRAIYVQLGRGEFGEGRSLDALQSAYRIGARMAWRRFVEAGTREGVDPGVLYQLGEAIFAYIEGLAAESTEGFAAAQSQAAGELGRERRRLVALLLEGPVPDRAAAEAAAERAGWTLPEALAVLVASADAPGGLLGPDAVAAEADGIVIALIADAEAPGRRDQLRQVLGDTPAALGPTVAWDDAVASADRARLAHRLVLSGRLPGPLVVTEDHLPTLALHTDPRLAADMAARALEPLAALPDATREKLTATLRAWLDHQGRIDPVAFELGIHPQTVRYRVGQLREVFGGSLDEPEGRFALLVALRAQ